MLNMWTVLKLLRTKTYDIRKDTVHAGKIAYWVRCLPCMQPWNSSIIYGSPGMARSKP